MLRSFCVAAALLLAGCGGGDDASECPTLSPVAGGEAGAQNEPEPVCEAGRVAECPCVNGGMGVQTCAGDGSAWEECLCEGVTPVPSKPPSEACQSRFDVQLTPPCPRGKPVIYAMCPADFLDSGTCVRHEGDELVCCPAD